MRSLDRFWRSWLRCFRVEADAIEIPDAALAPLWPALVHLVRNAIDHGIEPAAERANAHKAGDGTITLAAALVGDDVEISVRDDGGGVGMGAVMEAAMKLGGRVRVTSERGAGTNVVVSFPRPRDVDAPSRRAA